MTLTVAIIRQNHALLATDRCWHHEDGPLPERTKLVTVDGGWMTGTGSGVVVEAGLEVLRGLPFNPAAVGGYFGQVARGVRRLDRATGRLVSGPSYLVAVRLSTRGHALHVLGDDGTGEHGLPGCDPHVTWPTMRDDAAADALWHQFKTDLPSTPSGPPLVRLVARFVADTGGLSDRISSTVDIGYLGHVAAGRARLLFSGDAAELAEVGDEAMHDRAQFAGLIVADPVREAHVADLTLQTTAPSTTQDAGANGSF